MVDINVCYCIGKIKCKNKEGKDFYISYFSYNFPDKINGQGTFQAFDNCEVGKSYNFIMNNCKAVLINK